MVSYLHYIDNTLESHEALQATLSYSCLKYEIVTLPKVFKGHYCIHRFLTINVETESGVRRNSRV